MLTCLAMALNVIALGDIPALASEVETEARALTAQSQATSQASPEFLAAMADFSTDAMTLSDSLRAAGVTQDLPCIFRGISEDSHERAGAIQAASTDAERAEAFAGLRALLDDAILLAPMAGTAAQEANSAAPQQP